MTTPFCRVTITQPDICRAIYLQPAISVATLEKGLHVGPCCCYEPEGHTGPHICGSTRCGREYYTYLKEA